MTASTLRQPPEDAPKPTLSFCIPTYNRAVTVESLAHRILSCVDAGIEVVILDNGSTDDTLKRLGRIDDPRLSVYANQSNRGVIYNLLNALLKGRGRYCTLLLDKDSVRPEHILAFKDFLLREQPACGYCEYGPPQVAELFDQGMGALRKLGYACHHPSGYFFDAALLLELDIDRRFGDFDFVGHFPLDFVQAELTLKGRGAIYYGDLFVPEQLTPAAKKSVGTNAAREDAFFSPKGRLKMAIHFSRHIEGLPIAPADKRLLVLDRFSQGLAFATIGYRRLLADELVCHHYHIAPRRMDWLEMLGTAIRFSRGFVRASTRPAARKASVSALDIFMEFARKATRAAARRVGRIAT